MEGKIYSPFGNLAKWAKLQRVKYIALPASLPSGLKYVSYSSNDGQFILINLHKE